MDTQSDHHHAAAAEREATLDCDHFDIHAPAFVREPYDAYNRLRRSCPVARGESYGGYWLLTRYDDVREAARDWRTFTSSVPGVTSIPAAVRRTEPQLPLEVDPPLHSRYRALVNPVFSPARIETLRPRVEAIAAELIDALLVHARAGEVIDLVDAYAVPLSVATLAEFTGLPREESGRWVDWQRRMFDVHNREDGARATHEMNAYIDSLIAARRHSPREADFISLLLASEVDGHRLTDGEIRAFCQLQFGAGFETTADAMSVTLHYLAHQPQTREQLAQQLAQRPDRLPAVVEEFLRYATPIQIFGRNARHDLALHDRHITQGDVVALSFGSANHDPTVFPDPLTSVLDRFDGSTSARHLTFGAGVHLCLGAPVARLELGLTLRAFATRVPPLHLVSNEELVGNAADPRHPGAVVWKARGDRRGIASLPVRIDA